VLVACQRSVQFVVACQRSVVRVPNSAKKRSVVCISVCVEWKLLHKNRVAGRRKTNRKEVLGEADRLESKRHKSLEINFANQIQREEVVEASCAYCAVSEPDAPGGAR
jgi:hypothetical protein